MSNPVAFTIHKSVTFSELHCDEIKDEGLDVTSITIHRILQGGIIGDNFIQYADRNDNFDLTEYTSIERQGDLYPRIVKASHFPKFLDLAKRVFEDDSF